MYIIYIYSTLSHFLFECDCKSSFNFRIIVDPVCSNKHGTIP